MTTAELEDDRRRRGLFLLLVLAVLLMLLGLLLGYLGLGRDVAGGVSRPKAAATPNPVVVQPSTAAGTRPTRGPVVVVDGTGQAVAQAAAATGNGTAFTNAGPLVTTSRVVGDVGPSAPATLVLTLSNPGPGAVLVTAVSAQVTGVDGDAAPGAPACSEAWYHVAPFSGARTIAAGTRIRLEMQITLDDLPTVNQDSCKGAKYTYAYRAEAEPA